MFQPVSDSNFVPGEHSVLHFWKAADTFQKLRKKNAGKKKWSFLDGPITANNPMGVHHAWGRTYKDTYQRFFAMTGHEQRYQNGFDCQGLWVEVEVEKQLGLVTKGAVVEYGIDNFVNECKRRVLKFAARQTEQSQRLGYWMDWDDPDQLRELAKHLGTDADMTITAPSGKTETAKSHQLVEKLGNPEWGGSYFTFSTENNETIWHFLKKCFNRGKVYQGHDVMPWSGRGGSAYSQMEIAEGRKLTTHKSAFVRFPLKDAENEFLLIWTTTPWTLTSNVAAAVNTELDYVKIKAKKDDAVYYFAKDNLHFQRLATEFKEGFGRPEWKWPKGTPKLKTLAQIFKEQGGFEEVGTVKGAELVGRPYTGPFDELPAQNAKGGYPVNENRLAKVGEWLADTDGDEYRISILKQISAGEIPESPTTGASNATEAVLRTCAYFLRDLLSRARIRHSIYTDGALPDHANFASLHHAFQQLGLPIATSPTWTLIRSYIAPENCTTAGDVPKLGLGAIDVGAPLKLYTELRIQLGSIPQWAGESFHHVIDGGRDSRGSAHVVAGEGTGIVHMAPGCGDIDHKIGASVGMPVIAPLGDDGKYIDGFGDFAGKEAIAPETAELVFAKLKEKGLLVAVEDYPHIYPHCWRTGEELVFRLVDEWFINMDWRDEIKDVTKQIRWLPDSIDGQNREVEWLTNMSDWMISKKRFWGLALPIWVDHETGDFEVMGSMAELKERAVEGWNDFEGNTPHRPWIDGVKLKNPKTGNLMHRIEDVGNPWLDAGIVPFSTMNFNERYSTEALNWADWYPADLVTECFPGQFRNWFYSMLSLSTMMMHDESGERTADQKKPFRTLLGHRLVQNEEGKPMHKSDGTAIWFEEAAEQLGVDTMRWMYLQQNPATDLRFGTRHGDKPITLQTPEGPINETKEGVPTSTVTSGPADETRRQILIPLWNCYKFFVDYAVADGFVPSDELRSRVTKSSLHCSSEDSPQNQTGSTNTISDVDISDRPEIDRWVLSNLQTLIDTAQREMADFNAPGFCEAAAVFIDDLSNWYIRRNRRRFWRSKDATDTDKTAAYETLYEVLVRLSQLLAPCIPFLTERMYQNLVLGRELSTGDAATVDPASVVGLSEADSSTSSTLPESVHLCDFPTSDSSLLDEDLNHRMAAAQVVVKLGHKLREENTLRVRQPLAELQFAAKNATTASAINHLADVIQEELNIEKVTQQDNLDDLVGYSYKPNLKTLGPKYGKLLGLLRTKLPELGDATLAPLRQGENLSVEIDGNTIDLTPADVLISTEQAEDWVCADESGLQIAISTVLTDDLKRKGMSRDFVRQIQQLRKDADLHIQDRINIEYHSEDNLAQAMIAEWSDFICGETLAESIEFVSTAPEGTKKVTVGESTVTIRIVPVA